MKATLIKLITAICLLGLAGCSAGSKILNPYDDEFNCPYTDEGMCISVKEAYEKSFEEDQNVCPGGNCDKVLRGQTISDGAVPGRGSAKAVYQEKKYQVLAGLIQEEEPPVVVPPEVVRVLILSYKGDQNDMFGFRYAYFFGSDAEWMLTTAFDGGM